MVSAEHQLTRMRGQQTEGDQEQGHGDTDHGKEKRVVLRVYKDDIVVSTTSTAESGR